ncbi:MAG: transposase [Rubrivivax sp.]|nr:transposase [Rubrivivax sp.]
MSREVRINQTLCADLQGFSLHDAVRCAAGDRQALEQPCRYITRPALANERVQSNAAGQVVLKLKTPWRDGTTHLAMSPLTVHAAVAAGPWARRPTHHCHHALADRTHVVQGVGIERHGPCDPGARRLVVGGEIGLAQQAAALLHEHGVCQGRLRCTLVDRLCHGLLQGLGRPFIRNWRDGGERGAGGYGQTGCGQDQMAAAQHRCA